MADYTEDDDCEGEEKDGSLHCITFNSVTSSPNSIIWSADGRIALITDSCLYVLSISQTPKVKRVGSPFGLQIDTTVLSNQKPVSPEVGISHEGFSDVSENSFWDRQTIVLDRVAVICKENSPSLGSYCQVKWSPLGCTNDGRCILSTLATDGNACLFMDHLLIGHWKVVLNISSLINAYVVDNNWLGEKMELRKVFNKVKFKNSIKKRNARKKIQVPVPVFLKKTDSTTDSNKELQKFCLRKNMLFIQTICWCPLLFKCSSCLPKTAFLKNHSYANYFRAYVSCPHRSIFLLSASKLGYIFISCILLNIEESLTTGSIVYHYACGNKYPIASSWCQYDHSEGLVALGFANGKVLVLQIIFEENEGKYKCKISEEIWVWNDVDDISVSFVDWMLPKDGVVRLIIGKGTEILVFKIFKCEHDSKLQCSSCEIAPSCHSTPITCLQCVSNKFVLTSSASVIQYFDIENEILPLCDKSVLRGFKCFGVSSEPNMSMIARVSSPSRLLLSQPVFVKQMEITFLPFLPCETIANKLVEGNVSLDMAIREYFLLVSSDNFLLPNVLHKYCDEPASYEDISMNELKLYYCFNWVRFLQQTGTRIAEAVNRGIDKDIIKEDPVMDKINSTIEYLYYEELFKKCLQLLQNGWVKSSSKETLSLLLMADWLVLYGENSLFEVILPCYDLLDKTRSEKLSLLTDNLKNESPHTKNSGTDVDTDKQGELHNIKQEITGSNDNTSNTDHEKICSNSCKKVDWRVKRENCIYCNCPVALSERSCMNGHPITRCALSLRVFDPRKFRKCSICHRKTRMKRFDEMELTIDSVLLNIDFCPFCDGRLLVQGVT